MAEWGSALGGGLGAGAKVFDWMNQRRAMEQKFQMDEAMRDRAMKERMMDMAIQGVIMPRMMAEEQFGRQKKLDELRIGLQETAERNRILLQQKVDQEKVVDAIDRAEESGMLPEGVSGVLLQEASDMIRAGSYQDQVDQMIKESNQRMTDAEKEPEFDIGAMRDLVGLNQAALNLKQDMESLDPITKAVVSSILSADKEKAIWDQMARTEELTPEQKAKEDIDRTFSVTAQANTAIAASAIGRGDWKRLKETMAVLPKEMQAQIKRQMTTEQMEAFRAYLGAGQ